MTPEAPCNVCDPEALAALLGAEPTLAAHWKTLLRRTLEAGTPLQRAGDNATRCWLIERGVVRLYYLNDQGTERNRSFHGPGNWVGGSLPPLVVPSPYAIEALSQVDAVELDYDTLRQWQNTHPHLEGVLAQAIGHVFTQQAHREAELLSLTAQARYESFLAAYGPLAPQIPQHQVASYLGISPVSLSRIRARMGMADGHRVA
ncbi:Crp/Fnr family transcriptional regulator [Acidovorax sp. BL-A-41-H1]|uniref:Crp/Fnr family transcriptional regulator n=1 Tax=Acidovorax sp. BL-A-41-H1 TaxID=3421102 RepID=UPI003F7AA3F4